MDRIEISAKLKTLIEEQDEITIESNDQILDLDSYTMMLIITYVDEEMEVQLDMDLLDFDAFSSVATLTELVISASRPAAA